MFSPAFGNLGFYGPYGPTPTIDLCAFAFLLAQENAAEVFREMLTNGSAGGKLYGLLGLKFVEPADVERLGEALLRSNEPVVAVGSRYVKRVADIAKQIRDGEVPFQKQPLIMMANALEDSCSSGLGDRVQCRVWDWRPGGWSWTEVVDIEPGDEACQGPEQDDCSHAAVCRDRQAAHTSSTGSGPPNSASPRTYSASGCRCAPPSAEDAEADRRDRLSASATRASTTSVSRKRTIIDFGDLCPIE
jgi:hypothetical protein